MENAGTSPKPLAWLEQVKLGEPQELEPYTLYPLCVGEAGPEPDLLLTHQAIGEKVLEKGEGLRMEAERGGPSRDARRARRDAILALARTGRWPSTASEGWDQVLEAPYRSRIPMDPGSPGAVNVSPGAGRPWRLSQPFREPLSGDGPRNLPSPLPGVQQSEVLR